VHHIIFGALYADVDNAHYVPNPPLAPQPPASMVPSSYSRLPGEGLSFPRELGALGGPEAPDPHWTMKGKSLQEQAPTQLDSSSPVMDIHSNSVWHFEGSTYSGSRALESTYTTAMDSGYGSVSKTTTEGNAFNDSASDITDNLSIDLPQALLNDRIEDFVTRLADAVFTDHFDEIPSFQDLPDLLRAFSLRLSLNEGPGYGQKVGNFARKNREYVYVVADCF